MEPIYSAVQANIEQKVWVVKRQSELVSYSLIHGPKTEQEAINAAIKRGSWDGSRIDPKANE